MVQGKLIRFGSVAIAVAALAACGLPDRGTAIANEIRNSRHPTIRAVEYGGDNDESGPTIEVYLQPGATEEDARAIACEIVVPAVAKGNPPPDFGFIILDSGGEIGLASDETQCP